MTTPFDTALRVAERQLDQVRAAIGLALDELQRIEAAHLAIEAAMTHECALAAADPALTTERWFVRTRERRAALGADRVAAQAQLESLRRRAVECYGSRAAIETAATRHRDDAQRVIDAAEQAAIDDMIGARRIRVRRKPPRGTPVRHPGLFGPGPVGPGQFGQGA